MHNWANLFLHFGFLPFPFLLLIFNNFLQPLAASNSTTTNCALETNSTVRVLVLFDIFPSNEAFFRDQQIWTENILRHIDSSIEKNRPRRYGLIAFHRLAIVLTDLNAPQTSDLSLLLDQIHSLKPSSRLETSPAKALDMAAKLIDANDKNDAKDGEERPTLLFLVHDGRNTDMIAETLESSKKLAKTGVAKFALAIGQSRNEQILHGYTEKVEKILTRPSEQHNRFFAEINKEIDGECGGLQNGSKEEQKFAEQIQQFEENENESNGNGTMRENSNEPKGTSMMELCRNGEEKVDLIFLLDTSGSIFHSFSQQRQLVIDLLASLNDQNDQSLHVGLISFAAEPSTVLSLGEAVERQKMLARIEAIKFSGGNTRIADAMEMALEEIQKYGREKAIKILVLISDGHGDEFWARAQAVGRRLQQASKLNIFAVSTSPDFNRPELALYVGNEERIFVGQKHRSFVPSISFMLNKCLGEGKIKERGTEQAIRELLANSSTEAVKMELLTKSRELAVDGSSGIGERRQRDQPIIGEDSAEEENGGRKQPIQTIAIHLQDALRRLPADCPTDILFLFDRFSPNGIISPIFERQLRLAVQLVEKLPSEDVEDGRIQLAALSFGREPRLEAEWAERMGKADFQRRLRGIQPSKVQSSFAAVANKIRQIHAHRRPSSRLLIFVFWSGSNGRNTADELAQAVRPFGALPRTELFAISVNPSVQLERLRSLAGGDQWHVFLDARTKQFVDQASRILLDCILPPSGEFQRKLQQSEGNDDKDGENGQFGWKQHFLVPDHEPRSSVERVEHLQLAARAFQRKSTECKNDSIDLTILLHSEREKTSPEQFDALKRAAMDALRQAPAEHFHRRIRLSIWAGSQQIMSSQSATKLDDALFTLDRLEGEYYGKGGGADFVDLLSGIMAEMEQSKREKARLALIVLTDGIGEVRKGRTIKLTKHRPQISIFVLNFGAKSLEEELSVLFGINTVQRSPALFRLFSAHVQGQMARFVDEFRRRVIWCRDGKLAMADSVLTTAGKRARAASRLPAGIFIEEKMENATNAIPTLPPLNVIAGHQNGSKLAGNDCKVDLILIIDTSQSVAEEFQQQLQFAVELVRRLPDDDFEQRVQVGVVSFHRIGRIQFALGELKEKKVILSALSAIQHTGGSTSVVSGINLAVEEVGKRRRKDARLVMVLVSDGNSQDPWAEVLAAAAKLRAIQADVYAVTVSHNYFFRELEMYAGNKWFVYIDARIRQFLDEAEMSLIECRSPSVPATTPTNDLLTNETSIFISSNNSSLRPSSFTTILPIPSTVPNTKLEELLGDCRSDPVDLMFILDTSTSVERDFYAQKIFALDLIRVLPERDFLKRLSIGLIKFHSQALLQFPFLVGRRRDDVLYELERIEHTGGQTSLVAGVELALMEIERAHRPNARLIVVLISDGNSQDDWAKVQETAKKLRNETVGELYAVTLSEKYALEELLEYTKDEARIYRDKGIERFLQDVGHSVASCPERELPLTPVPIVWASPTPTPADLLIPNLNLTKLLLADGIRAKNLAGRRVNLRGSRIANSSHELLPQTAEDGTIQLGDVEEQLDEEEEELEKCRYTKMDLIIILDASTSRETVFEHQRELALSLIERLPINRQNTHVATGINSFTNVPVLRQTLGLGRDRKMVRKAIEDIKYRGGSTLTSKAVELAIQDLERGRRGDALQVVVLMNDGMSQDPWEKVLSTSKKLAQTGAHRFGVALGDEVDLRELKNYIGDEQRIYRDGSTERFLQDVVSLLNGTEMECAKRRRTNRFGLIAHDEAALLQFQEDPNRCQRPKLDLMILLDNTDASQDGNDPKLNANRYLLLDVLGSLPLGHRVQMAVLSIGAHRLEYQFLDEQQREPIFRHIEQIRPTKSRPNYAKAIGVGVDYLATNRRPGARGMLLLVGDGRNTVDTAEERAKASALLKRTPGLSCHAVDSSKTVDEQTLIAYTGSSQQIYAYDRNAEFAHFLLAQAMGAGECHSMTRQQLAHSLDEGRQKDIASAVGDEKLFGGEEKVLKKVKGNDGKKEAERKLEGKEVEEEKLMVRLRPEYRESQNFDEVGKKVSTTRPIIDGKNLQNSLQRKSRIQDELEEATTRNSLNGINRNETGQTSTTNNNHRIHPDTRELEKSRIRQANPPQNVINSSISPSPTPLMRTFTLSSTKSTSLFAKSTQISTSSFSTISPSTSSQLRQSAFRPKCFLDVILLIDSSGSVEQSFEREKQLAAEILEKLRIGPENARIALIKFAAVGKVRTVHSFGAEQTKERLLAELKAIQFSDGITAIHSALQQAIIEYSPSRGARPGLAQPLALIFTDGFGMQDFSAEANQLRHALSNQIYAITVDNDAKMPMAREELIRISGDQKRVFTERNFDELFGKQLRDLLRGC